MRWVVLVLVAGCAGRAAAPTLPRAPAVAPAHDLGAAKPAAPPAHADAQPAKDPRVVDLDIIRITAHPTGVGGDAEMNAVSTSELFEQAEAEAKAGRTEHASALFRQLVTEFPKSRYATVALFDIAAINDGRGDTEATIAVLRELLTTYPASRESVEGQLYIAALQADKNRFADAVTTLDAALARSNLTFADRIEARARKGYALIELHRYAEAETALDAAVAEWHQAPHLDDSYYIAMAVYYQGELAHRRFLEAPLRLPDEQLYADMDQKRALAVIAYDHWKACLDFKQAYWATAAGYQMSQIFVELWQATVQAPYPTKLDPAAKAAYIDEVHRRVREDLSKALEGHRMNVELAKAYGVDTPWSRGSATQAARVMDLLAEEADGRYVTPERAISPPTPPE